MLRSFRLSLGFPIVGSLLGHRQACYAHLASAPMHRAADIIGATIDAAMQRRREGSPDAGRLVAIG